MFVLGFRRLGGAPPSESVDGQLAPGWGAHQADAGFPWPVA
jgi:hypothetical protein